MRQTMILPALILGAHIALPHKPPARYCADLRAAVQALVKLPLTVAAATDAATDDVHAGEPGYVSCVFSAADGSRITIILSDDPDKRFTDIGGNGYRALAGFGDLARSHAGNLQWVDVMKKGTFCEALVGIDPGQLTEADWTHAGGKMCDAAFAAR